MVNDIQPYFEKVKAVGKSLKEGVPKLLAGPLGQGVLTLAKAAKIIRAGEYLEAFIEQMEKLRAEGRIDEKRVNQEEGKSAFQEVLEAIESDGLDEKRFRAIKALFFKAMNKNASLEESHIALELIKILRGLSLSELIIIFTAYRIYKRKKFSASDMKTAHNWLSIIAQESGYKHKAIIERVENNLVKNGLLHERVHADRSAVTGLETARLTSLGVALCEFVERTDPELVSEKKRTAAEKAPDA